jgi:phosphate transport system permease protein
MSATTTPIQPEAPGALISRRRLSLGDPILSWGVRILSWAALLAIVLMLIDTAVHSGKLLEHTGIWAFLTGTLWAPASTVYGALPFIYGTIVTSLLALLFAVPLSIGAALLVNEYLPGRLAAPVSYGIELLAAIPSVVYGFWGIIVVVPALRVVEQAVAGSPVGSIPLFAGPVPGPSYLAAGVVLAIMILPIITSVARDAMRATPRLQREGALALGATHWETIRHVVMPFARGGIFAGVILGLSRAIGETIAVLFVIGNQPQINASIFAPGYSLPSVIAGEFAEANQPFHPEALIALGVILFTISFLVNVAARGVVGRFEARAGGADVR